MTSITDHIVAGGLDSFTFSIRSKHSPLSIQLMSTHTSPSLQEAANTTGEDNFHFRALLGVYVSNNQDSVAFSTTVEAAAIQITN